MPTLSIKVLGAGMNQNRRKEGPGRQKSRGNQAGSDYRLFIVLGGAVALALLILSAILLTSR
jgi:hypothetical protein